MTDHESNHSQSGNLDDESGLEEQIEINLRMEPGIKSSSLTVPSDPSVSEELELSNDNTMVYALVEVSKDSEKTSKRQKIPLSARDFYQVMQKFIDSKKDKCDRKILRPLKRKYGMECGNSNMKIAKAQKQFINSKLANQNSRPPDKISITHKHSNHATPEKLKKYEIYRSMYMKDQYKPCNQEKSCEPKVLYSRNNLYQEEIMEVKRDRCILITRGTNTDIVQTPKLLEDILLTLHSNFVIGRKEETSKKNFITGDLSRNECDEVNEQPKTQNLPEIQNLLFVPLIVMDKNHDVYKKCNSCDTCMCNEDPKCSHFSQEVKRTCDQFPNSDENHKSFKDLRSGTDSAFHLNVLNQPQSQLDCLGKKGLSFTNIKRKKSDTEAKHTHVCRGEYFLEEVKTLQLKLSAFIKSLEVINVVNSQNSATNNNTNDSDSIFGGKKTEERHSSLNSFVMLNSVNPGQERSLEHTKPYCHDFSVQVVLTKPMPNKTETEPSNTKAEVEKALKTINPLLDRSFSKIMITKKSMENILIASKSSPFSQVSCEYRVTKSKRTTSLPSLGKRDEALDILNFNSLGIKVEESRYDIDSGLQTGQKESKHSQQKIKSEFEEQKERVTDILYKKNFTVMHERENAVPVNPEKILKTAISTSCNKIQNGSIEKMVNGIKVPNKETKKTKESTTPSNSNISSATSKSGNSIMIKNKCDEKPEIMNKTRDPSAESEENEKVSKGTNPITENESKKQKAVVERTVKPESRSKESKLKKPMTPVRSITKTKVRSSKVQSSSEKVVCKCLKNRKSAENLIMPEKDDAYSEKIKNTLDKRIEVSNACQKRLEKPNKNIDGQEKVHETEVKTTTGKVCTTEKIVGEPTTSMNKELNSYKTGCTKPKVISKVEESLTPNVKQTSIEKQPQELKSIWALTKVILYKDGSQSFEVLEASSTPPGYVLNSNKKKDSNINSNSHGSNSTNTNTTNNSSINADSRKSNTMVNNSIKTDNTYITHSNQR